MWEKWENFSETFSEMWGKWENFSENFSEKWEKWENFPDFDLDKFLAGCSHDNTMPLWNIPGSRLKIFFRSALGNSESTSELIVGRLE